jgi:Raf kinase inhibitor-like YbhB/YbcL family protein
MPKIIGCSIATSGGLEILRNSDLSQKFMQAVDVKQLFISSPSFDQGEHIPEEFTCDDLNISPPLEIRGIPGDARSLAIVMEDPDAPGGIFDHWLVWNIPPTDTIPENTQPGLEGRNSSGKIGYMGPCPPSGTHRYFFKVYAVDMLVEVEKGADKTKLDYVLKDHVLAYGELIGLYSSKKKQNNR